MPVLPTITFTQLCKIVEKRSLIRLGKKAHISAMFTLMDAKPRFPNGGQNVPKGLLIKIIKQDLNISVDDFMSFM